MLALLETSLNLSAKAARIVTAPGRLLVAGIRNDAYLTGYHAGYARGHEAGVTTQQAAKVKVVHRRFGNRAL